MFAAAGATSLDDKLALLDHFESYLRQNLPGLYAELNDFWIGQVSRPHNRPSSPPG